MAQAWQHQKRTVELMLDMAEEFERWHPKYTQVMQAIAQSCYVVMAFIEKVSTFAWGYFPEDINTWLK